MVWSMEEKVQHNQRACSKEKRAWGQEGGTRPVSWFFNSVGEIPKYKQSWETMTTSIAGAGKSDQSHGERDGEEKEGKKQEAN